MGTLGTALLDCADHRRPTCIYAKRTVLGKARVILNTAYIQLRFSSELPNDDRQGPQIKLLRFKRIVLSLICIEMLLQLVPIQTRTLSGTRAGSMSVRKGSASGCLLAPVRPIA